MIKYEDCPFHADKSKARTCDFYENKMNEIGREAFRGKNETTIGVTNCMCAFIDSKGGNSQISTSSN